MGLGCGVRSVWMAGLFWAVSALAAMAQATGSETVRVFEGRSYHVTPETGSGPLVLALHGGLGSGGRLEASSPLAAAARLVGARVIYPDAPNRFWNDGRFLGQGRLMESRDDVGHLLRLVRHEQQGLTDRRVFVIGHSNGGGMAMALACAEPSFVSGVAVIATKWPRHAVCAHPEPVATLFVHGTEDPLAPHDGNRSAGLERRLGPILSSDSTLELFSQRNRCSGEWEFERQEALPSSGVVPEFQWALACEAPLARVVLQGGGHGFPGGQDESRFVSRMTGPAVPDFDAALSAMAFWGLIEREP